MADVRTPRNTGTLSASQHCFGRDQRFISLKRLMAPIISSTEGCCVCNIVLLLVDGGLDKFDILSVVFGFMSTQK